MRPRRTLGSPPWSPLACRGVPALLAVVLSAAPVLPAATPPREGRPIVVGSKAFAENRILAEAIAQLLTVVRAEPDLIPEMAVPQREALARARELLAELGVEG